MDGNALDIVRSLHDWIDTRNSKTNPFILWNRLEPMRTFMVYCTLESEEPFIVEAETLEEAKDEALKNLGWHLIEEEPDEEE